MDWQEVRSRAIYNHRNRISRAMLSKTHPFRAIRATRKKERDELKCGVDHRLWHRRGEVVAIAKDKVVLIISPDGIARHFVILQRVLRYLGSPSGCLH